MIDSLSRRTVDRDDANSTSGFALDLFNLIDSGSKAGRPEPGARNQQQPSATHNNLLPAMERRVSFFHGDENAATSRANFSSGIQRSINCRAIAPKIDHVRRK